MEVIDYIKRVPIFEGLDEVTLNSIIDFVYENEFEKGEIIIHYQSKGTKLFIIVSGTVKVLIPNPDGREKILALLGEGECFGELSILDGEPTSATVEAIEKTHVLIIDGEDFIELLCENPDFCLNIIRILTKRLRNTDEEIRHLTFDRSMDRLYTLLLDLAITEGKSVEGGIVLPKRLTHLELSELIGVGRETVSRNITKLIKDGLINYHHDKRIIIITSKSQKTSNKSI
ncbi:MAG: Crp/Fnr family transcriptional regulator [bacterium]